MTREHAYPFWVRVFRTLHREPEDRILENSAIEFTERAKSGEFNALSDEEYNVRLNDAEQESALFERKRYATSYALLIRALQKMTFTATERSTLIKIFVQASQRTDFRKEGAVR